MIIKKLPELIKENDQIKGAVISALSGVVSTKDDLKMFIKEIDKRFEAQQQQIADLQQQIADLRKEMDERFKAQQQQIADL
ncbi:MAG: hypothetical protein ACTSRZ_09425 [Promethearchaeota archaeon]